MNEEIEFTINELLEIYPKHRNVSDQYYKQLKSKVNAFQTYFSDFKLRPAEISNFMIQEFINHLHETGRKHDTLKGYKAAIKAVCSLAKDLKLGKVTIPKGEPVVTECFKRKEIKRLVKSAKKLTGKLSTGVDQSTFWQAAIHSAYSTGLRRGDLLRVKASDIKKNGRLNVMQHKTNQLVRVRFSEDALKYIEQHGQKMAVPWPHSDEHFGNCFAKLRDLAGIKRGTWKWLRRSAGSYADKNGNGHELLGNTRQVFEKHYRDMEVTSKEPPLQVAI